MMEAESFNEKEGIFVKSPDLSTPKEPRKEE
jgi:hypothetical protein